MSFIFFIVIPPLYIDDVHLSVCCSYITSFAISNIYITESFINERISEALEVKALYIRPLFDYYCMHIWLMPWHI